MSRKLKSLLRLVSHGDWSAVCSRWRAYAAQRRVARSAGQPFIYHAFGCPLVCYPDWPDSLDQFATPPSDLWEVRLLKAWLRPGDSALDLGANLGLYTSAFADKVGPSGKVLAVDADSFAANKIKQGTVLSGQPQVGVLHGALAEHDGEVLFYVRADHSVTGTQSLRPDAALKEFHTPVSIPAFTMKGIIRESGFAEELAVIKVDVEGAEGLAFRGIPPVFVSKEGPFWLVEIFPETLTRFGTKPSDITDHFSPEDFDLWLVPKHPQPGAKSPPPMRRLGEGETYEDSLYYNFLAIPLGGRWADRRNGIATFFPNRSE